MRSALFARSTFRICAGATLALFLVVRPPLHMAAYAQSDSDDGSSSSKTLHGHAEENHYVYPDGTQYSPDANPPPSTGDDQGSNADNGGTAEPGAQDQNDQSVNNPTTTDDGSA